MIDLSALNKEQYQAVTTLEGYIRVVASPGSGKTRALTYRYAYLVDHLGINPSNILCFTYTNKAADEMKGRICNLLDNEHYDFTYISTIHSYCWTFLRQYFKKHHMDGYWILDDSNFNIMVINMSDLSKLKLEDIKEFHNRVNAYKYNNLDYIRYLLDFTDDFKIPDVEIYKAITLQKRAHGLYFEDLVCATIYLLRKEHQLLMEEGGKFSYILVDEFQDTSPATYQIIKLLSSVNHNLFVVGDVDQSIFSFIGGDPEIFLHQFDEDFPHNITLYMNHNYRSTCEIIKACNQLIENNGNRFRDKHTVSATRRHGHYPITYTGKKDTLPEQALTIVKHLHDDLLQEYNSIFIISATNYELDRVKDILVKHNIPIVDKRVSARKSKEDLVVEELLSCVMFAYNENALDLKNLNEFQKLKIPEKIIDKAIKNELNIVEYLNKYPKKYGKFLKRVELTREIMARHEMPPDQQLINIAGIHEITKKYNPDYVGSFYYIPEIQPLSDFILYVRNVVRINNQMNLIDIINRAKLDNSYSNEKKNGVYLLTAHGAKGLESENVIVYGQRIERFVDEEKTRVAYVALTRAKKRLFIVTSDTEEYQDIIRYITDDGDDGYAEYNFTEDSVAYFTKFYQVHLLEKKYRKELNKEKYEGLKLMMSGANIFLTGEAGTGKTYLLKLYLQYLSFTKKKVTICAPTGLATNNFDSGVTTYSAFDLFVKPTVIYKENNFKKLNCDVLIIDEISMVRIDMFEYMMKCVMNSSNDAHPIQVIVCGDFFQLPPIVPDYDQELLHELFPKFKEGFAFESKLWNLMDFKTIWLKEIFRQDNAQNEFIHALNDIRRGENIEQSISYINQHASKEKIKDGFEIHGRNYMVNQFNLEGLNNCIGQEMIYKAKIEGEVGKDVNLEKEIHLKIGARVMTLFNCDHGVPYKNGSFGYVIGLGKEHVDVLFDDGGIDRLFPIKLESYDKPKMTMNYWYFNITQGTKGTISQIPLKLAYGVTIHKSQGQTFEKINLDPDGWDNGQLYVALSRIKKLENLYLYHPLKADVIKTSSNVIEFYKNLK